MSGLNSIINSSLSGLFTNQAALRTTSNNIANVNTEDYSRLRVVQGTATLQGQAAGVEILGIERVVDEFLNRASRTATSNTSEFTVQREFHDRLQGILGRPDSDSSLANRLNEAFNAFASLSISPADTLRRQQTLAELEDYLSQIQTYHDQIESLRSEVSNQIIEAVEDANQQLAQIRELNPLLVRQTVIENDAGSVENQLDAALQNLSEIIDISVERGATGGVTVRTGSGLTLVDTSLRQLEYNSPGIVNAETIFDSIRLQQIDPEDGSDIGSSTDMSSAIRSGRIQGLLDLRDGQLADLSNSLGELAARVRDEFNRVHNEFTAAPAPNSLTGGQTIVEGTHATGFTGVVTFAAVDANNQLVASTTVDFDAAPPANFNALVTQVNTGLGGAATLSLAGGVMSFTGAGTNGVLIAQDETNPSERAGRGFSHFFGMNDLVTSDSDGIYETGVAGTDTHGITSGDFTVRVSDANNRELAQITVPFTGTTYADMLGELNNAAGLGAFFTFSLDANGKITSTVNPPRNELGLQVLTDNTVLGSTGVSFTDAFGIGDSAQAVAARDIGIVDRIFEAPDLLSLSQFDAAATIGQVPITNGDQRGALALQGLETTLVGFATAGELQQGSLTLSQYTANWLGNAGLQARRATNLEEDNIALQNEIDLRRTDVSGVNMDEELSNLIIYQNAYNAAARVLSSVQELYDELLNIV